MTTFLREIELYLERTGMPPSRFGRAALGDPGVLQKFRDGTQALGERRIARMRAFMERYPDGVGALQADPQAYASVRTVVRRKSAEVDDGDTRPPTVPLSRVAADSPPLARHLEDEAARMGLPIDAFLSDLIALGWRCHVEDLREGLT